MHWSRLKLLKAGLALEVIFYNEMRYINLRFTYLLTYLLSGSVKDFGT